MASYLLLQKKMRPLKVQLVLWQELGHLELLKSLKRKLPGMGMVHHNPLQETKTTAGFLHSNQHGHRFPNFC